MRARETLETGLADLGITAAPERIDMALAHIELIAKWNRVDNLTAITDPEQMVTHHLLDSLSIHPHLLDADAILDIGAGAGLPGIPLAIFNGERRFVLLDAAAKRVRFMRHAVATLGLDNVEVVQARADRWAPPQRYDAVVSRAFARTADFVRMAAPALAPGGRILAMKGRLPRDELSDLPENFEYTVTPLNVPGLAAARHLITITASS